MTAAAVCSHLVSFLQTESCILDPSASFRLMASKKVDFIIYGASGYTGQYVVREVARKSQTDKELRWAVAGRSKSKLQDSLRSAAEELGKEEKEDIYCSISKLCSMNKF